MIVVPESIMVSKSDTAVVLPDAMLAPVICQKPVDVSTSWNSIEPEYRSELAPPR